MSELIAGLDFLEKRIDQLISAQNRLLEERRAAALVPFLMAKAEWSLATFGEGRRTQGICAHILKELGEIHEAPLDLEEWIDVFMLATDGYWRAWVEKAKQDGVPVSMEQMALDFVAGIVAKHQKNVARKWPKPVSQDIPVEHDRSGE